MSDADTLPRPGAASAGASDPDAAIVIPTKDPGPLAERLIAGLARQQGPSRRVIVVDSGSRDGSPELFRDAGFAVHVIADGSFDHGGTRNLGAALAGDAEILVFMTQDAIPANDTALADLIRPFADGAVGLAYGRQLPRQNANPIERHARLFNYPAQPGTRAMPGAAAHGVKAIFNSNSFAAYRASALTAIGGFPERTIMGEDQIAAARLLLAGWTIAYQAEAAVTHSHGYTIAQEFRRYFDIGVFHAEQAELLARFARPFGEGRRFVRSEYRYLLSTAPHLLPGAMLRTAAKLAGYKLGHRHAHLPSPLRRWFAMNPGYFRRH